MSSSICLSMQQTCFEPLLMQPRVLGLALFPHVQPSFPSLAPTRSPPPRDQIPSSLSYWYNVSVDNVACQEVGLYVHPLIRRSASAMSEKSLEMCTESLGSETGNGDFLGDEDEAEMYPFFVTDQCREFPMLRSRKTDLGMSHDFPPPLKSMTGSTVVRMRPCRSNGRLILQAVSVSYCCNSFLIERGEGRLRLSLFHKGEATGYNGHEEHVGEGQEDQEEEEERSDETGIGIEEERIGGGHGQWPCRCKEGKGLLKWKPCWVATLLVACLVINLTKIQYSSIFPSLMM